MSSKVIKRKNKMKEEKKETKISRKRTSMEGKQNKIKVIEPRGLQPS